jgi:hypothetical protein
MVNTSGNISTVAGNNTQGSSGYPGPATSAQLNAPLGVAVDASNNFYIADRDNNAIYQVVSGNISVYAGGTSGYAGDGGGNSGTGHSKV